MDWKFRMKCVKLLYKRKRQQILRIFLQRGGESQSLQEQLTQRCARRKQASPCYHTFHVF